MATSDKHYTLLKQNDPEAVIALLKLVKSRLIMMMRSSGLQYQVFTVIAHFCQ